MSENRRLPDPIGPLLQDAADEAAVQRIWTGVRARRVGAIPGPRRVGRWVVGGALAAAALVLAAIVSQGGGGAGPLARRDGSILRGVLAAPGDQHARIALDDASTITL